MSKIKSSFVFWNNKTSVFNRNLLLMYDPLCTSINQV